MDRNRSLSQKVLTGRQWTLKHDKNVVNLIGHDFNYI